MIWNRHNIHDPDDETLSIASSLFCCTFILLVLLYEAVQWPTDTDSIDSTSRCEQILLRQEWRTLSDTHKDDYIRAVKCTQTLPNITSYRGVQSRFDDFQAVHIHTADSIHFVGHFLPWHRGFVSLYEKALREECGYRGAIPYWDWSQDVAGNKSIRLSPLLDPRSGFGGDGVNGTYTLPAHLPESSEIRPDSFLGCVLDGPFAYNATDNKNGYMVHLGPGKLVTTHCLVRGIDEHYSRFLGEKFVKQALAQPTFEAFRTALEGALEDDEAEEEEEEEEKVGARKMKREVIRDGAVDKDDGFQPSEHDSGHLVMGGELGNLYSSPGDPLFYLHHANIDRIWWMWQKIDLERRLLDISGSVRPPDADDVDESSEAAFITDPSSEEEEEEEYNGIDVGDAADPSTVALDFQLRYGPLGRMVSIRELMDVTQSPLCYRYV